MNNTPLADLLYDAARAAFRTQKDPASASFRDALFAEFLVRWHFVQEDLEISKATRASGSYLFCFTRI
jgi:hypothetical protein